jgi:hypothetical protein
MTTYVRNQSPFTFAGWGDPADWVGGVAPNSPTAIVDIPTVTEGTNGAPVSYYVTISPGESFAAGSVFLGSDLFLGGTLDIGGELTVSDGYIDLSGVLSVGALDLTNAYYLNGSGTLTSPGTILNNGTIGGDSLDISVVGLDNTGTITSDELTTIDVTGGAGSFANLNGGTLSGGTFGGAGTLIIENAAPIVVDAADIKLSGTGSIMTVGTDGTVSLTASIATIAASGTLSIPSFTTMNTLTVDGTLLLGGNLTSSGLVVNPGGVVTGTGTIDAPVTGLGTVLATGTPIFDGGYSLWHLVIDAPVGPILELLGGDLTLLGATASNIDFMDTDQSAAAASEVSLESTGSSVLTLDAPSAFTGTIDGFNNIVTVQESFQAYLATAPEEIVLPGLSLSSLTSATYTGDDQGGTLTLVVAGQTITLHFAGYHALSDFAFAAGSRTYSNSPPSLIISEQTIYLTGDAPTLDANGDTSPHSFFGTQDNASLHVGAGAQTIVLTGTHEFVLASAEQTDLYVPNGRTFNNEIFGPAGDSSVTFGDGNNIVVMSGSNNTVVVGNGGTAANALGGFTFVEAGSGKETVSAGNGTNIILAGGYSDTITVGNGLNLIFDTDLSGAPTIDPVLGAPGHGTLTLGTGNNFAYLDGTSNTIISGGGTDAIWGGTGGDRFVLAPTGGALFVENFGNGDVLDLSKILAGVPLAADLSNIGNFVRVVGTGPDDTVFGVSDGGSKTVLQVVGASGTAYVNLENVGSLGVAGLLADNALVFPKS